MKFALAPGSFGICRAMRICFLLALSAAGIAQAAEPAPPARENPFLFAPPSTLLYDKEYPGVPYTSEATANPIARLQTRVTRGEVKLAFNPVRGYLDSLLTALDIDVSSQTLVFSKTSFQVANIRASSPRAIYFNEDTYVAWTPGAELLEIGTMDTRLGPVFYSLPNRSAAAAPMQRELLNCLSCHDSLTLTGGGVPRFILGSGYVGINGEQLTHEGRILTTDRTPLRSRWGGWYVTGQHGDQVHLGNVLVRTVNELVELDKVRRGNLDTLDGLFDTQPYLSNRSDIVALLILQHQAYIQNQITRVNFEVRTALLRAGGSELTAATQKTLQEDFMEPLVQSMLFADAAVFTSQITGNSGFDKWLTARGPRDKRGRSLRELDLKTRLFRYPLSYLVYSEGFDALPEQAKTYIYGRFKEILEGRTTEEKFAYLSADDRKAVKEILTATKPDFAKAARRKSP